MPSNKSKPKPKPSSELVPAHEWAFEAIGTQWWVGIYQPLSYQVLKSIQVLVTERIEVFDKTYSRFRDDSLVTLISHKIGRYAFPPDSNPLFGYYRALYDATNGLVTPLIGQVLADAGYDASYSLTPGVLSRPPGWDSVMEFKAGQLTTQQPVLLDFGAAGKGYLIDIISQIITDAGVTAYCVDGSGDMHCQNLPEPLRIGLENPDNLNQALGVATLRQGALCASSGSRRQWAGYNHILNPQDLQSPMGIKAVWTTAQTAMEADGLATALFFVEPAQLQEQFSFSYAVLYADNTMKRAADFPAEVFTNE